MSAFVLTRPSGEPGPWVEAWVTSPSSRTLMVRAIGQDGPAGPCGRPQVQLTASETDSEVRVTARYSRILPGSGSCADVGYGPTPHPVQLEAPLGARHVVDASTGATRTLRDASRAATITTLPPGFTLVDLGHDLFAGPDAVRRSWKGPHGGFGSLVTQTVHPTPRLSGGRIVQVDGHRVRFHAHEDHPRDVYDLEWRLPSGTQVTASLHVAHGTWTLDRALSIVESIRPSTDRA